MKKGNGRLGQKLVNKSAKLYPWVDKRKTIKRSSGEGTVK
jgi:hypothetical protein